MRKLFFTLLVILSFCNLVSAQNTIEPRLQEILNQKSDEMISVNIILKSQMNFNNLRSRAEYISDKDTRRNVLVDELKSFTEKEQQAILSILKAEERSSTVKDITCHWLANYINCNTTRDVIYQIAQHPDVLLIGYNEEKVLISNNYSERSESITGMTENITKVNADDVWNMGYTGDGIIVAVIDSGVNYKHVDIASHLWDGGAEFPNHGYNTYENNNDPMDRFGHGTHCAGTVCGDGTSGTKTGIAPKATLMCVKSVSDEGTGSAHNINSGMEWAVEHNADVLSMSLGVTMPTISEKTMLRRSCVTALELGIVASVAAGNYGTNDYAMVKPVPDNVIIPGGCPPPWMHPDQETNAGGLSCVVSVGAVDYNDNPADFSSNGPVTWESTDFNDYPYNNGELIGLIRPDISAPGVSIVSLDYSSTTEHTSMNGTSMATPCVAGIMCLMLEKDPKLTPADICRILETTSVKLSTNKNNKTGSGRVDALAAMNAIDNGDFKFISHKIDDVKGNNNANINSGESVNLNITFKNDSEEDFSNIKTILKCKNEFVTITDSIAQIDIIKANENVTIENFAFTLDKNTSPKTLLAFDVYFYNENNEQIAYQRTPLYAHGSELQFSSFVIKNDKNGNGVLEAGETADLGIVLNNIGNEIAVGLKGTISSTNAKLTINKSEAEFNSIGGNSSTTAFFNVTLAENAGDNIKLPIKINISDAFNNTYEFEGTYKNSCEVIFELYDNNNDGWNGAALIVSYSDGTPDEAFTILEGMTKTYKRKIANEVEVSLEWVKGTWDLENSFVIKTESDNIIYRNGGFLNNGFLYSWINNCSCQNNSFEMCEPVKNLNADINKKNVILTWNAPNDQEFIKYEIYRDTKLVGETDGLSFVDTNIEHNRAFSYTYSVRPIYEDCIGSFKSIIAQWGVDVNEYSHNINVNVYPNPANDKLYIETLTPTQTPTQTPTIDVYDIYGRRQQTIVNGQQTLSIDLSELNAGIYFIKITTEEGSIVKRIIKK